MSDSVRRHRRQPTRLPRPWDSPGKNTGVGCHFLLQCMKVKSESEVAQSCPTISDPMDCSLPGSSVHGIFQARVLEWGAIAFSVVLLRGRTNSLRNGSLLNLSHWSSISLITCFILLLATGDLKHFFFFFLSLIICYFVKSLFIHWNPYLPFTF